jgi:hypothetical protein
MNLGFPLIIIVIFLVVWIISNVIRAQQDAAQAAARRTAGNRASGNRSAPVARVEKTSTSDIDRFLQEIDRLRRKEGQQKAPVQESPPAAAPPREKRQQTRPPQPKRAQPKPKPTIERKALPSLPPPPSMAPEPAEPPRTGLQNATPVELKYPEVQSYGRTATPARPSRPAQAATPMSDSLALLQTLFRTKQGTAAAVLLHEILGRPKCRR